MDLLVLGGTIFLGRHCVAEALSRGHRVTLFHRGVHGADLFPEAHHVFGDRNSGLDALGGSSWDAVLDTCGYVPRVVAESARFLTGRAGRYVFVSTVSVYRNFSVPGLAEDAPTAELADPTEERVTAETYGPLKAACERSVQSEFAGEAVIVRPGLIVGPWDTTDRFTYWTARALAGGTVLAPGDPERPVQFIDARDLAAWLMTLCESGRAGVWNAVGPQGGTTFGELVETCCSTAGEGARPIWVSDEFLLRHGVAPWSDLPLWLPENGEYVGLERVDGSKAFRDGLRTRSVAETVSDTMTWYREERGSEPLRSGLSREREQALLEAWALEARPS